MNRLLSFLWFLVSLAAPARADSPYSALRVPDSIAMPETANRDYRLLTPPVQDGAKMPLVIYLHGAGAKGSENDKQFQEPLPKLLTAMREKFPCFILVPQCRAGDDAQGRPNNWVKWVNQAGTKPSEWLKAEAEPSDQLRGAMGALDHVLATQPIDTTRIYLTGVSMGGSGAWYWAAREPSRFAAVITACGLSEAAKAPALAKLPIWAFHGTDDDVAPVERSRNMVEALRAASAPVEFTEYTGAGHNIALRVFTEKDHVVLKWLFEQRSAK